MGRGATASRPFAERSLMRRARLSRFNKDRSPTDATQGRPYLMYPSQSSGLRFPFEFIVSNTCHPGAATRHLEWQTLVDRLIG